MCFFGELSARPSCAAAISAAIVALAEEASSGSSNSDKLWQFARLCAVPSVPYMMQQQALQTPRALWSQHRATCVEIASQTQDSILRLLFDGTPSLSSIRWRGAVTSCSTASSSAVEMAQRAAFDTGMFLLCLARGDAAHHALQLSRDLVLSTSHPMTSRLSALQRLLQNDSEYAQEMRLSASELFFAEWKDNELVVQSWMAANAGSGSSDSLHRVKAIMCSSCFRFEVPNDVYVSSFHQCFVVTCCSGTPFSLRSLAAALASFIPARACLSLLTRFCGSTKQIRKSLQD
jgi:hypothetical protein